MDLFLAVVAGVDPNHWEAGASFGRWAKSVHNIYTGVLGRRRGNIGGDSDAWRGEKFWWLTSVRFLESLSFDVC